MQFILIWWKNLSDSKEFSSTYWHWIGPVKHWLLVSPLVYVVFGICPCFLFAVCLSDKAVKVVALWYLDYIDLKAYINVGIGRGKVMPKDISQHPKWWSNHFVNLQRWILEVQALSQYLCSLCSKGSVLLSALISFYPVMSAFGIIKQVMSAWM